MNYLQKRRLKALNKVIEWYGANVRRRAFEGGNCRYITDNGKRCAIGRMCSVDKAAHLEHDVGGGVCKVMSHLPSNVQSLGVEFLTRLQYLHDIEANWGMANGLSYRGVILVNNIKRDYINN